ncbi:MAG: hypothetical protein ACKVH0_14150, partial [Alphaproteobacteria bacterium]
FSTVTFRNGMIRMELGSLPVAEDVDGKQAQMEAHSRVVLTPQGFLQGLSLMQDLARRLADAGVIRRSEAEGSAAAATATPTVNDEPTALPPRALCSLRRE